MTEHERNPEEELEKKAENLRRLREAVDNAAFSGDQRDITGELTTVDQHTGDLADATYQRELGETTREVIDEEAAQAEAARQRLAAGTYGTCEVCGRPIPPERLRARPHATLCIECQGKREASRRREES
ncbi:MAG: hypothetical protein GEU73_01575 [Chloroflexi bacterium]|nr:hypothetical protein [Chloroflexota bacterium]